MKIRAINNTVIVLLFALMHFLVAILSRALDYYDDIPLTILTITMVIVVSMRNNTRVEMMAVMALATTLLGYVFGSWLGVPMMTLLHQDYLAPAITTFIVKPPFSIYFSLLYYNETKLKKLYNN